MSANSACVDPQAPCLCLLTVHVVDSQARLQKMQAELDEQQAQAEQAAKVRIHTVLAHAWGIK